MTSKVSDSTNAFPGSVSKFTSSQLAAGFILIMKDPRISKIVIPQDTRNLRADIQKMLSWKIDHKYNTVEGIGDLNRALVRIMCHSIKPLVKKVQASGDTNQSMVLKELEKQLTILKSGEQTEDTKKSIAIKILMIEKLKTTTQQVDEEEKQEFTPEKMASVAKRVYDILIDQNRAPSMYEEIVFLMRPKVDHVKEAMGGDYVLANSDRDRRYKNDGSSNWRNTGSNAQTQSQTRGQSQSHADTMDNWRSSEQGRGKHSNVSQNDSVRDKESKPVKYTPPDDGHGQAHVPVPVPTQQTSGSKGAYVPPHLKTVTRPEFSDNRDRDSRYSRDRDNRDSRYSGDNRDSRYSGDRDNRDNRDSRYSRDRDSRPYNDRHNGDRNNRDRDGGDRGSYPRDGSFVSIDKLQGKVDITSVSDFPSLGGKGKPKPVSVPVSVPVPMPQEPNLPPNQSSNKFSLLQLTDDNDEYDYNAWDRGEAVAQDHRTADTSNGLRSFAAIAKEAAIREAMAKDASAKTKGNVKTDWGQIVDGEEKEETVSIASKLQPIRPNKLAQKTSYNDEDEEDYDDWGGDGIVHESHDADPGYGDEDGDDESAW